MAITIDLNIFCPGQEDVETQCTVFIEGTIGTPDKTTIVNLDESDPEAGYSLLFYYKDLSLNDFPNVHFAGDALSARGITVSGAHGIYIAEKLIK